MCVRNEVYSILQKINIYILQLSIYKFSFAPVQNNNNNNKSPYLAINVHIIENMFLYLTNPYLYKMLKCSGLVFGLL